MHSTRKLSPATVEDLVLEKLKTSPDPRHRRARLSALVASRLGEAAARHRQNGDPVMALRALELTEAALLRAEAVMAGAARR